MRPLFWLRQAWRHAMTDKRLILHIGTHKTGTTSFQRLLADNETILQAQGVFAVSEPKHRRADGPRSFNCVGMADLFLRPEVLSGARLRQHWISQLPLEARQNELSQRQTLLAGRTEEVMVLSAEVLCFLRTASEQADVRHFLAALERRVQIVLVTRDMAEWRASWASQLAKDPKVAQGMIGLAPAQRIDGPWYFDLEAIRQFWQPLGQVIELAYDDHSDICRSIFQAAPIPSCGVIWPQRLNQRPD